MNTTLQQQPYEPNATKKWLMDAVGIMVFHLGSIAESIKELVVKSSRPKLRIKGKEIIMVEDLAIGLGKSTRTFRRLRSEGKLSYWVSKDGHTVFVTQDQFEEYILNNFVTIHSEINNAPKSPA